MRREKELIEQITNDLRQAGIPFYRGVAIGGVRPDFIVFAPDGRRFVIEVKTWKKSPGFRNRAAHQADLFKEVVGADLAFLVVDGLERSRVPLGVVTPDKLIPALKKELAKKLPPTKKRKPVLEFRKQRHVFAAMPFDPKYDDVFFVAMVHASETVDAVCKRVDKEEFSGDIVSEIHSLIQQSVAVIVDLSESKPNVLYEAGFARALPKPVIHICSTPLSELPFDVAHWNTIQYDQGQTYHLREPLATRLKAILP